MSRFVDVESPYRPLYSDLDTNAVILEADHDIDVAKVKGKKRLACTSCRQAKIKCVGLRPGSKCERCRRKSISCQVNSQYQRISQNSKLQALSDEVKQLRGLMNTHSTTDRQRHRSPDNGAASDVRQSVASSNNYNQNAATLPAVSLTTSSFGRALRDHDHGQDAGLGTTWTANARTLEGVTVDASQISRLFLAFYHHFHPQMPVVNDRIPVDRYFELSPLLSWTILAIAARSGVVQSDLHIRLQGPLTQLLWAKISAVPVSHFTIQAIVLLCIWPYSPASLISDPTSMLVSIAKAGCVQLGLHRPDHMQDYHRVRFDVHHEHVREAVVIWVCCFLASESVTSGEGHDPIFPPEDPVLARAAGSENFYNLPTVLHQVFRCYRVLHELRSTITQAEYGIPSSPTNVLSSLLRAAELSLENLKTELECGLESPTMHLRQESAHTAPKDWSQAVLHCVKMQICIIHLHQHPLSSHRQHGLMKALQAAIELVELFDRLSNRLDFCFATPRFFGQNLKLAALLLLKLRFSAASKLLDVDDIEQRYRKVISLHRKMSIHENDFDARAAAVLNDLWKIRSDNSELQSCEPVLTLTSRSGASLLHESQWQWRDYYTAAARNHQHLPRPPRVLPSIILHSPDSQQGTNDDERSQAEFTPSSAVIQEFTRQSQADELNTSLGVRDNNLDYPGSRSDDDQLPVALDLMYAYLNPDEEASQLFYPPWSSSVDDYV